jgi:hypothetical protein
VIVLDDGSERRMAQAVEDRETRQTIAHIERYMAAKRREVIGMPTAAAPLRTNAPRAGEAAYEPQATAPGGRDRWVEIGAWAFALTLLVLVALALYWAAGAAMDGSGFWR